VTKANYALRLQASLKREAERATLNQFINVAVAEKLSALRTAEYFKERAARADIGKAIELLDRSGDEFPREGDQVAPDLAEPRRSRGPDRVVRPRR
jgi:hypothetical protein